jgi:hypothetical protein
VKSRQIDEGAANILLNVGLRRKNFFVPLDIASAPVRKELCDKDRI